MNYGHWKLKVPEFNPEEYFGFIYVIENKISKKSYIGKKNFHGNSKNWKTYKSSSRPLLADIRKFGIDSFEFTIIELHTNNQELSDAEINIQTKCNVLWETLQSGEKAYYNISINCKKFNTTGRKRPENELVAMSERNTGKTWNEMYSPEKIPELKAKASAHIITVNKSRIGLTYEELYGEELDIKKKHSCSKATKGKTYEEIYGSEKALQLKKQKSEKMKSKESKSYIEKFGEEYSKELRRRKSESMKKTLAAKRAASG